MKMLRLAALAALVCLCAAAEKWTVDDILFAERADQLALSPDGKLAVWVKSQMDREKGETVSNLVLKAVNGDFEVQLTRGTDNNAAPKFSPDGKRIAFLSTRKPADAPAPGQGAQGGGGPQVWMIDVRGGEPWAVTKFEKGVRGVDWMDNDTLLLVAPEDSSLYEQRVKERKDTSNVVEDEENAAPVRLFRFDIKSRNATRISDNKDRIERAFLSPDGAWAVTIHNRSLRYIYDQQVKPAAFLFDLKKGTSKQLFAEGKPRPQGISWAPDSKGFYFSSPYGTHPLYDNATIRLAYYYDLASAKVVQVNLQWENGLASVLNAAPGGFLATLANGARPKLASFTRTGDAWTRTWIDSPHAQNITDVEVSEDGKTVAYVYTTASVPPQWYACGPDFKSPKQITDVNPAYKKRTLAKTELVYWKGARDEQVEGILYYPQDYQPGKKYPLIVMIHGGPASLDIDAFSERFAYPHNLYTQRGAFLFKPNYHGSTGYGLKWVESITNGMYNELEWIDVEKGVDSLIAKGLVDPQKLGVMGWSNGSIITIELTTRTTRYKAASAGAGDVNWISDWGNAVFGRAFDDHYFGKSPLQDPQLYVRKSPLFRMDKVTTPTIIFFGTEDKQVPTEQGWQHYRALQQLGKTDVRFILFPGEAHGPRKLVHQRRKLEEELAWFDKYLFQTAKESDRSLKQESPLAAALKKDAMGEVPETVERGNIRIGRFEVTRAQYAAFDPQYRVAAGTVDYPASGIVFDKAKAYCEWLSKKTGRKFLLGTEEEMQGFLKPAKGENTLDFWAGYPVNADDFARLSKHVASLGEGALLRPVGSFAGSGEDPVAAGSGCNFWGVCSTVRRAS
jgi:dipeptidyl aminopeptidase/acylaminoacyl peptidase